MKFSGWVFMTISWAFILGLAVFCFTRIFKKGLGGEDSAKAVKRNNSARGRTSDVGDI